MDDSLNEGGICVEECPKLMGGNLIDAVAANERENRGAGESISVTREGVASLGVPSAQYFTRITEQCRTRTRSCHEGGPGQRGKLYDVLQSQGSVRII